MTPAPRHRPARAASRVVRAALAGAVGIAVLVTGCGDGEPDAAATTTDPPLPSTAADWRSQLDDACGELNEEYSHLRGASPADAAAALAHTRDVRDLAAALDAAVRDAGVPQDAGADVDRLGELSAAMADAAADLADAAADSDGPGIDDATARVQELGEQLDVITERLGIPACGGY